MLSDERSESYAVPLPEHAGYGAAASRRIPSSLEMCGS
jgi:hypothetical protein